MIIDYSFSSPNYSVSDRKIDYIIIHYTEMKFDDALNKLTNPDSKISSHYLIKEDGMIYQLVKDKDIAWHAGISSWHNKHCINKYSIGIELDNLGDCSFTELQITSCINLCRMLKIKFNIQKRNFLGHSDIAPNRKIDPGLFFDWKLFADNDLGIWHNLICNGSHKTLLAPGDKNVMSLQRDLRTMGYNVKESGIFDSQTNFVVRAFQSKFFPEKILKMGMNYYKNDNSLYYWDSFSQKILSRIISRYVV